MLAPNRWPRGETYQANTVNFIRQDYALDVSAEGVGLAWVHARGRLLLHDMKAGAWTRATAMLTETPAPPGWMDHLDAALA